MKIMELLNSDNAVKIALQNENYKKYIFAFEEDWNGENYTKLYDFDYNTGNFVERKVNAKNN